MKAGLLFSNGTKRRRPTRILRKYNVSFDHYIEVPLIEQVMGKMPPIKDESPEAGKEAKPENKAAGPNGKPAGTAKPE
ncbi:MAG: hypothetical protein R3F31_10780 [Verrucomicrobiales bacterium]